MPVHPEFQPIADDIFDQRTYFAHGVILPYEPNSFTCPKQAGCQKPRLLNKHEFAAMVFEPGIMIKKIHFLSSRYFSTKPTAVLCKQRTVD